MKSPETKPRRTDEGKAAEAEDYSIYPHQDGVRVTPPWKLGDYGDAGVLSETMKAELCERFAFPEGVVERLSVELGYCLDDSEGVAINLVEVKRSQAIMRGQKELKRLIRRARQDSREILRLKEGLAEFSAYFAPTPDSAKLLPAVLAQLEGAIVLTQDLNAQLDELLHTPGAVADMSPSDIRNTYDNRRHYVVETCCYAWRDVGRELTYTSYSDGRSGGRRQGPLIDFIQSVGKMITKNGWHLSGETLRKDIEGFRKKLENEEAEFWAPPIFGN